MRRALVSLLRRPRARLATSQSSTFRAGPREGLAHRHHSQRGLEPARASGSRRAHCMLIAHFPPCARARASTQAKPMHTSRASLIRAPRTRMQRATQPANLPSASQAGKSRRFLAGDTSSAPNLRDCVPDAFCVAEFAKVSNLCVFRNTISPRARSSTSHAPLHHQLPLHIGSRCTIGSICS